MKIAIIGRSEVLYETTLRLHNAGHEITCILTAKESPEYTRKAGDFEALADKLGVPFTIGSNISKFNDFLANSQSEIAVSVNFSRIIPQSIIDIFPLGILNAHGGDLPKYRGNACQAWAILNGESEIGLCVHKMVGDELDSGDIITRSYFEIGQYTKITSVYEWIKLETPLLFLQAVDKLKADSSYILEKQSINTNDIIRTYPRQPDDGRILWNMTATYILRLINASNKPYSGAFFLFNHKKIIAWDAKISTDNEIFYAIPGQITKITNEFTEVACGEGKIRLIELEEDGKVIKHKDLFKSLRDRLG
mgnify:CR=1 FL=1